MRVIWGGQFGAGGPGREPSKGLPRVTQDAIEVLRASQDLLLLPDCVYHEVFKGTDGDAPDGYYWNETDAWNIMEIKNDTLYYNAPRGTIRNADITSRWKLSGDFDIRAYLKAESVRQPGSGMTWSAILKIAESGTAAWSQVGRGRASSGANTGRCFAVQGSSTAFTKSTNTDDYGRGWIRLTRSSSTIKAYWWHITEQYWAWDDDTGGIELDETFTGDCYVTLGFDTRSGCESRIDNLRIYSGCANIISPTPTTTAAPTTEAPTTEGPTTLAVTTTYGPTTTPTPTTEAPSTEAPSTAAPTTAGATTTSPPTTEPPEDALLDEDGFPLFDEDGGVLLEE